MDSTQTYWASKPPAEIVNAIRPKVDQYFEWIRSSGRLAKWARQHRQYYAGLIEGAAGSTDGDEDELIAVNCNSYRNLLQHILTNVAGQRPEFNPRANNSDHKSQSQCILAKGILDYVLTSKGLEQASDKALEMAVAIFDDAFLAIDWDSTAGVDYAADEEGAGTVKTGDVRFRAYSPLDCVRDFTKSDQERHSWHIVRDWEPRWDLAARVREHADKIVGMPTKVDATKRPRVVNAFASGMLYRYESEDVEVFTLYHDRTPALPDGRMVRFLLDAGQGIVLFDGPLPFDEVPVYRVSPAPMIGTSHGYGPGNDMLSLQEAENAIWSTVVSNNAAFGVQMIWTKNGDGITPQQIGGLKLLQSTTKPEPLQLTATAPETYQLLDRMIKAEETISGVNAASRGNPEANVKSGAMAALLTSQTAQYSQRLQKGWVAFMEAVGTGVIKLYRRFAKAPQVVMLVGKANQGFIEEFTGSDLDRIERVSVELGNPLSRTVSGRIQMADILGERGLLKTVEEYIQVLSTGRLEPVLEATQKEMLAIKAENERLADVAKSQPPRPAMSVPGLDPSTTSTGPVPLAGVPTVTGMGAPPVVAVLTDNHPAHIREHAAVIASPDAREAPPVVQACLAHVQEHLDLWRGMDPGLAQALQIPPYPVPMMAGPGMPPGGPSDANGSGPSPGGPPPPEPLGAGMPPPPGFESAPNMPQMPTNPATGERAPGAPS